MEQKEIICTVCPMGCRITVTGQGEQIQSVTGNTCPRGDQYARSEFIRPMRLLTSVVKVENRPETPLVAVRTDRPVPKDQIFPCMEEIRRMAVTPPIRSGAVLIADVAGTGADVIASASVD